MTSVLYVHTSRGDALVFHTHSNLWSERSTYVVCERAPYNLRVKRALLSFVSQVHLIAQRHEGKACPN